MDKRTKQKERKPLLVPITLRQYWQETITKREARRRLAGRHLTPRLRREIERSLPDRIEHYITLHGGAFREYADLGQGFVSVLLIIPGRQAKGREEIGIMAAVDRADQTGRGGISEFVGVEYHRYAKRGSTLYEDGEPRRTFRYARGPLETQADVSFVMAQLYGPIIKCCNSCEVVHSVLNIHSLDKYCCLGSCYGVPGLPWPPHILNF